MDSESVAYTAVATSAQKLKWGVFRPLGKHTNVACQGSGMLLVVGLVATPVCLQHGSATCQVRPYVRMQQHLIGRAHSAKHAWPLRQRP